MVKNVKNKGKGAAGKRKEKRTSKFKAPAKRNNILSEDVAERKKERRQEANIGFGLKGPKERKFKEKPFARPAKPAIKDQSQAIPDVPLSKKELKQATEAWKAKRKPNYATVQVCTVRGATGRTLVSVHSEVHDIAYGASHGVETSSRSPE